jgi:hypothetical protein
VNEKGTEFSPYTKGENMDTSVTIAAIFVLAVAVAVSMTRRKKK